MCFIGRIKAREETVTPSWHNWLLRNRPFLVYVPSVALLVSWSFAQRQDSNLIAASLVIAGLTAWTLIEWLAHRAMHFNTNIAWLTALQDQAHLRHHREPHDLEHSVLRLSASIPLAAILFGIGWLVFRDPVRAALFHAGLLLGYMYYEFVHLTAHAHHRLPGLKYLHRYHALHHFVDSGHAFGVTTSFWDRLFGTLPKQSPRQTSSMTR